MSETSWDWVRPTGFLWFRPPPDLCTVFENHRKSLIQHCERSELRLHFEWTKVNQKCQKWSILASFWRPKGCGQTVLPDRSDFIGQKLVENAKIEKFKWDILSNFQTMCIRIHSQCFENSSKMSLITRNVIKWDIFTHCDIWKLTKDANKDCYSMRD